MKRNKKEKKRKQKRLLIVANLAKGHINQFHMPFIKMMKDKGWRVDVLCIRDATVEGVDRQYDAVFRRNPLQLFYTVKGALQVRRLVKKNAYAVVHCHTPIGGVVTRLGCIGLRKKTKVIYEAHGFHFFRGASLLNWLIYFPMEWILSFFTDILITINSEDYRFARKHLHPKKTSFVHGVGIDFTLSEKRDKGYREKIGISKTAILFATTGELIKRKNHARLIEAFSEVNQERRAKGKTEVHLIILGDGSEETNLKHLIKSCHQERNIHLLGYRKDVSELLQASDYFIFPSHQEGLPKALMEAMAVGLPIACSRIRGSVDLLDKESAIFFSSKSTEEIRVAIRELLRLSEEDKEKCRKKYTNNLKNYSENFILLELSEIYDTI